MSENEMDHLGNIVKGVKSSLNSKDSDYVSVFIMVLIGEEEDVIEAEEIIGDINLDNFACKSARIKMSDWLGKKRED